MVYRHGLRFNFGLRTPEALATEIEAIPLEAAAGTFPVSTDPTVTRQIITVI